MGIGRWNEIYIYIYINATDRKGLIFIENYNIKKKTFKSMFQTENKISHQKSNSLACSKL